MKKQTAHSFTFYFLFLFFALQGILFPLSGCGKEGGSSPVIPTPSPGPTPTAGAVIQATAGSTPSVLDDAFVIADSASGLNDELLVVGSFEQPLMVGTTALTSKGGKDILIIKYKSDGSVDWVKAIGSVADESAYTVLMDMTGNIYVGGYFQGTVDFGNVTKTASGYHLFVAKYKASGDLDWVQNFGGTNATDRSRVFDLTFDSQGNLWAAGTFEGTLKIGMSNYQSIGGNSGDQDLFVLKMNPQMGTSNGSSVFGGTAYESLSKIASDSNGDLFITGSFFDGSFDFGNSSIPDSGETDIFIVKLSANQTPLWAKKIAGTANEFPKDLILDQSDNVVLTGSFQDSVDFGSGPVSSTNPLSSDIFLMSLKGSNGDSVWDKTFGSAASEMGFGLFKNKGGFLYAIGDFEQTADFGKSSLTSGGDSDVFLLKLTAAGAIEEAKNFGGADYQIGQSVHELSNGKLRVVGTFKDSATFDNQTLTAKGKSLFIVTLEPL